MSTVFGASERFSRLKSATIGFGVAFAALVALAGTQFLLAPHTVAVVGRMDPEIETWAVSQLRRQIAEFYAIVSVGLAAYWLLSAIAGSRHLLRVKSANLALVFSGLAFALAMAVASFVQVPEAFKGVCPILGLSDTLPLLPAGVFSFDAQTPCETFLRRAVPLFIFGLPTILLAASAILRIVGSRAQA